MLSALARHLGKNVWLHFELPPPLHSHISRNQNGNDACRLQPWVSALSSAHFKQRRRKKKTVPTRRLTTRRMRIFNCPQRQRLQRRLATDFRQIFLCCVFYQRARSATNWSWHFNRLRWRVNFSEFQISNGSPKMVALWIINMEPPPLVTSCPRCPLPVCSARPECDGLLPQRRKLLPLLDQWTQRGSGCSIYGLNIC